MKAALFSVFLIAAILVPSFAADTSEELAGKWSGNWTPQGGIPDSMTIEFTQEGSGRLTGKFLTPVPMEFTRASFDPKTHAVVVEGMDQKSGKHYRIDGKVQGTEIKGTLGIDSAKADLLLIKWTYVPR
jgi:L-fucose isomerase-like protein